MIDVVYVHARASGQFSHGMKCQSMRVSAPAHGATQKGQERSPTRLGRRERWMARAWRSRSRAKMSNGPLCLATISESCHVARTMDRKFMTAAGVIVDRLMFINIVISPCALRHCPLVDAHTLIVSPGQSDGSGLCSVMSRPSTRFTVDVSNSPRTPAAACAGVSELLESEIPVA